MIRFALLSLVLAMPALADEPPPDTCFGDLKHGDACSTDSGAPGTCVQQTFEYEADGAKHSVTELICVATVNAAERDLLPWLGAGLAFVALCVGLATRRRPPPRVQSPA